MRRSLAGPRQASGEDAVCGRVAGVWSETFERTDSSDMDRRHSASRLLRLQRRQHAQPLLRVSHTIRGADPGVGS